MKLTNFSETTLDKFKKVINKHHFEVYSHDDYHCSFGNDKILLELFISERGDESGFLVKDKLTEVNYYMFRIRQQILGKNWNKYNKYMTDDEIKVMYKLENSLEGTFYSFFIILENYCDEIINGDFKIMNGENSEIIYGIHRFK